MADDEQTGRRRDLAVEIFREFLSRVVTASEMVEVDLPHIVVCTDPGTGLSSYAGPFPDVLDALTFAEREAATDPGGAGGPELRYSVAALFPAHP